MLLVELFDEEPIENIAGFILTKPRKVVFLGEKKKTERFEKVFRIIADKRKIQTVFDSRVVNRNNLQNIVEVLEDLVCSFIKENPDEEIVFDLCGGEDLMLVAAGIVYKNHNDAVELQRFNVYSNRMIDCDENIVTDSQNDQLMTIEECMLIHGGCVMDCEFQTTGTSKWTLTPELIKDIHKLWSVCVQSYRQWNVNVGLTAKAVSGKAELSPLSVSVNLKGESGDVRKDYKSFLEKLSNAGLINNFVRKDTLFIFDFKNLDIKQCLIKEGVLLELFVTSTALDVKEDELNVYNDVMMGVQIDWDGVRKEGFENEVENEIDVIAMKGLRPVFISCKNGKFDDEELFKFSTVSEQFGGKYVKKALVTNYLSSKDNPAIKNNNVQREDETQERYRNRLKKQLLWSRAQEMGIKIVCRDAIKDAETAAETFRNLCK